MVSEPSVKNYVVGDGIVINGVMLDKKNKKNWVKNWHSSDFFKKNLNITFYLAVTFCFPLTFKKKFF